MIDNISYRLCTRWKFCITFQVGLSKLIRQLILYLSNTVSSSAHIKSSTPNTRNPKQPNYIDGFYPCEFGNTDLCID